MTNHWIFDARIIRGGYSGIARYTSSLLAGLLKSPHLYDRLTIILEDRYDYAGNENYEVIEGYLHKGIEVVKLHAPPFSWRHHYVVSRFVNKERPTLYFYPHFDVPYWIRVPTTFVIHDLFAFYVPDYFGWRNSLMKRYYSLTIKRALDRKRVQLVTVSEASRTCIAEVFGEPRVRNARVVYETSPVILAKSNKDESDSRITGSFLLYVGSRRPNKNLQFLVEIFRTLKESFNYQGRLVMACGSKNWDFDLDEACQRYDFIDLLDEVSDQKLGELYQKMDALLYPSLYEGFGLPIVEAAAYGKKIITSDVNSMKEISPDWALLIDPKGTDFKRVAGEIAQYLRMDLDMNPQRYRFCQLSWEQIAEQIFTPQKKD